MEIRDDRSRYAFRGTDFELRVWEDPQGQQKPIFVVEELSKSQNTLLAGEREALARALTERVNLTPDQVTWVEQKTNGDLQQFKFTYSYTQRIIPDGNDMDANEARRAADRGEITFTDIPRYNARAAEVSPEQKRGLQAATGDTLMSRQEAINHNKVQEADAAQQRRNEPSLTD